jgi:hypothetical protein
MLSANAADLAQPATTSRALQVDPIDQLEHEREDYQKRLTGQAKQYRTSTAWERYFWAAPGLGPTAKTRTRIYYQTAFVEAEKYYALHPRDSGIANRLSREDLFSLCNFMLDPYMNSGMPGAMREYQSNQALIRKRIWLLYQNAFGPDFQATKRAKIDFESYRTTK